jgi:hypothetical protein
MLRRLLGDPSVGGVWLVLADGSPVGYAIVTYGYDLEFGGRDSYLTELWIGRAAPRTRRRARRARVTRRERAIAGVRALHLQVRPDNAKRSMNAAGL